MRLPTVLRYLLAALTIGCASGTALAQTPSRVRDGEYWEVITTAQGCHAILSDELEMHWGPDPNVRFSWNGGCDASGLITGSGTLSTEFRSSMGSRVRTEMSGVAKQGLFAGRVERATYSDDDDFNPNTPPGAMVLFDQGVANPMAFFYKRGCSYFIDSKGAIGPEPDFSGCNGNDGIAFWKKTLAEGVPNGSQTVKQPAAKPQAAAGDEAFQSNLKTFEADQLFGLTNELIETGQIDLAKLARNALLQRFPDSPLVPLVAQLISNAPKVGAAPAPAPAPAPIASPPATQPVAGQHVYMNDGPQLIAAFARIGVVMNTGGNSEEFLEGDNLFSAFLSDCREGRCHAVQLLAAYAISPMPTLEKVDDWNVKNLYGRAYISNNHANFTMVVLIPEAGIDTKALEEAVTLFKVNKDAFYNSVKPQNNEPGLGRGILGGIVSKPGKQ